MRSRLAPGLLIASMIFLSLACSIGTTAVAEPTPTVQNTLPAPVKPTAEPTNTQVPVDTLAPTRAATIASSPVPTIGLPTAAKTNAKVTVAATARVTAAATAAGTGQSAEMTRLMKELSDAGVISSPTGGSYRRLSDFEKAIAKINYFTYWRTNQSPTNFVLTADTAWQSAYDKSNWFNAGCGFVFHETDVNNAYYIFLGLDGNVYLVGIVKGQQSALATGYYGKVETMDGSAKVALVVNNGKILYYVNGKQVVNREDKRLPTGNLAFTVFSGTNYDFGTRCTIENIEINELK